jgi:hypothetical protein
MTLVDRAFSSRRVRHFGGAVADRADPAGETWFDLYARVFNQKTIPELVISLTHDPHFAPMKAWFAANAIAVREYAPYATPDAADPVQALSLPKLSEFCRLPETVEPKDIVVPAWVGSGWRRFTAFLTSWAESDDPSSPRH